MAIFHLILFLHKITDTLYFIIHSYFPPPTLKKRNKKRWQAAKHVGVNLCKILSL